MKFRYRKILIKKYKIPSYYRKIGTRRIRIKGYVIKRYRVKRYRIKRYKATKFEKRITKSIRRGERKIARKIIKRVKKYLRKRRNLKQYKINYSFSIPVIIRGRRKNIVIERFRFFETRRRLTSPQILSEAREFIKRKIEDTNGKLLNVSF